MRLEELVTSKSLLKDIQQLSGHHQTETIEAFHSLVIHFGPKMKFLAMQLWKQGELSAKQVYCINYIPAWSRLHWVQYFEWWVKVIHYTRQRLPGLFDIYEINLSHQ